MLNWWLGRPAEDATRDGNELDAPETPAPVFAARAIKSAIFGTPAWREENELERPRRSINATTGSNTQDQIEDDMSPTKPQGILVTPGTAATRRKTVSFGAGVLDNETKNGVGKSGIPNNCPGKFPSPWTPRIDQEVVPSHRTALMRTLEVARNEKTKMYNSAQGDGLTASKLLASKASSFEQDPSVLGEIVTKVPQREIDSNEEFDGDMTTDLNEPHSQSGRYWKSEYQKYHDEALAEMKKLVKYKQLAKSYARKKDSEAVDLAGKLREEQQKVANMEMEISELVTQIAHRRLKDSTDESPKLMRDLARQTAIVVQYKDQVDRFQRALVERDACIQQESIGEKFTSPRTAQTLIETSKELKRAREQLAEMGVLRNDIHSLRLNLSTAEEKVSKLQEENFRLSRDFAKVNEEFDRSEKRRQHVEAQGQKQEFLVQTIQKEYSTLKELAKSQRRDAEQLLRKRHEQAASLKQEILSLKLKGNTTSSDNPIETASCTSSSGKAASKTRTSEIEPSKVSNSHLEDLITLEATAKPLRHTSSSHRKVGIAIGDVVASHSAGGPFLRSSLDKSHDKRGMVASARQLNINILDSKIPTVIDTSENGRKTRINGGSRLSNDEGKRNDPPSKHPALAEIINDANADSSPARNNGSTSTQLSPGFQERFSNLSLSSPGPVQPVLEMSFAYGLPPPSKRLRNIASPRPSMFTFPSSPPKQVHRQAQSSGIDSGKNIPPSRLSSIVSSRNRTELPPDRAAAARVRLQQKMAKKRRGQDLSDQKENIRV